MSSLATRQAVTRGLAWAIAMVRVRPRALSILGTISVLRKWFRHDPARWQEFRRRYAAELQQRADRVGHIRDLARRGPVTLVYATHDDKHNDAVVLRDVLLQSLRRKPPFVRRRRAPRGAVFTRASAPLPPPLRRVPGPPGRRRRPDTRP